MTKFSLAVSSIITIVISEVFKICHFLDTGRTNVLNQALITYLNT